MYVRNIYTFQLKRIYTENQQLKLITTYYACLNIYNCNNIEIQIKLRAKNVIA